MNASVRELINQDSEVASTLLPALFSIFDQWRLKGREQMTLLGLTNEKTYYNWKRAPGKAKLTPDLLERASYLLGIYKALQILLPDPVQADQWLSLPNDNALFNGARPIDRLLAGQVLDLAIVRAHLDFERGR